MDPTDIVLVPFDLHRLFIYVAVTTLASLLVNGSSFSITNFVHWFQAALAFWMVAVICGTPPNQHIYHTILASAHLAMLTILLPTHFNPTKPSWWHSRLQLPSRKSNDFYSQLLATCQIHATLFLTVPFLVLRLYDWGSQIQRWPLPILLGSTYGFAVGSTLGSMLVMALNYSPRLQGWYDSWATSGTGNDNPHQD